MLRSNLTPAARGATVHLYMTTTRPASAAAPTAVHLSTELALVLGVVPLAPRLPSDVATLVAFAGPRSVRTDVIRGMIADALVSARAA